MEQDKNKSTILVKVGNVTVGAIQSLSELPKLDGERNPRLAISRIRFDKSRIQEAFNKGMVHKNAQRIPFQIEIQDGYTVTIFKNAWIQHTTLSFTSADWVIGEGWEVICESKSVEPTEGYGELISALESVSRKLLDLPAEQIDVLKKQIWKSKVGDPGEQTVQHTMIQMVDATIDIEYWDGDFEQEWPPRAKPFKK